MPRRFGRRFGGSSRAAVSQKHTIATRKAKCKTCGLTIQPGESIVVLRLKKRYRGACVTCSHKLASTKRFHAACLPPDINKAMGHDPTTTPPPYVPPSAAHQCAPPPKPPSTSDLQLAALVALETAFKSRLPEFGLNTAHSKQHPEAQPPVTGCKACEIRKAYKTYQGVKARVLRPGTEAEGETAVPIAIKRLVDIVYHS